MRYQIIHLDAQAGRRPNKIVVHIALPSYNPIGKTYMAERYARLTQVRCKSNPKFFIEAHLAIYGQHPNCDPHVILAHEIGIERDGAQLPDEGEILGIVETIIADMIQHAEARIDQAKTLAGYVGLRSWDADQ